jgi:hypothetical protein
MTFSTCHCHYLETSPPAYVSYFPRYQDPQTDTFGGNYAAVMNEYVAPLVDASTFATIAMHVSASPRRHQFTFLLAPLTAAQTEPPWNMVLTSPPSKISMFLEGEFVEMMQKGQWIMLSYKSVRGVCTSDLARWALSRSVTVDPGRSLTWPS